MPDFWQFPTVSMGLGPIMSIYQARFMITCTTAAWRRPSGRSLGFLGDGETDEPETWARSAWPAGKTRQPDLGHQLQPAAA